MQENQNQTPNTTDNEKRINGKKILTVIIAVLLFSLTFLGGYLSSYLFRSKPNSTAFDIIKLMEQVGYIYDPVTGEEREITQEEIGDALVNAYLDQYSAYFTEQEYNDYQSQGAGNHRGVGVAFYSNLPVVDQVIGNSPAEKAGLRKGDILLSGKSGETGEVITFTTSQNAVDFIASADDSLDIYFEGERAGEKFTIKLKKSEYVCSYVWYYDSEKKLNFSSSGKEKPQPTYSENTEKIINSDKIAYIRLSSFEGDSFEQMERALSYMKERGRTRLVLDLIDNGGGYMDIATKIASCFINNGGARNSVVAVSKGKTGENVFYTDKNRFFSHIEKMCVLANENTASASECLLGVLVHYKDLLKSESDVILEKNAQNQYKTYGKGIMQTTYKLLSGGALKLTTAKIYWPDYKSSIHGVGFTNGTHADKGRAFSVALEKLA